MDLSDPGIKTGSPALQADSLATELSGSNTKTATDSMQTSKHGSVPKNFVYKQVTAQMWAVGPTLPHLVNSNGNRSQYLGPNLHPPLNTPTFPGLCLKEGPISKCLPVSARSQSMAPRRHLKCPP